MQSKLVSANLNDSLTIDCLVEAFPRANSFWSRLESEEPSPRRVVAKRLATTTTTQTPQNNAHLEDDSTTGEPQLEASDDLFVDLPTSKQRSSVSVKQSAVNSYTYKLSLSIARVQSAELGIYACSASNNIGSSQAVVHVLGASKARDAKLEVELPGNNHDSKRAAIVSKASNAKSRANNKVVYGKLRRKLRFSG